MKRAKRIFAITVVLAMIISVFPMMLQVSAATDNRVTAQLYINKAYDKWTAQAGLTAVRENKSGGTLSLETKGGSSVTVLDKENIDFDIDPNISFAGSNGNEKFHGANTWNTFDVDICYWDEGFGGFYFQYDAQDGVKDVFVQCENTQQWRYARFTLYDAKFYGGVNGHDFRIVTADSVLMPYGGSASPCPVYLYYVKVHGNNFWSSFDITAETEHSGNVFYEGEPIYFNMKFKNVDGSQYSNMRVRYSIYKPEASDAYFQWEEIYNVADKGPDKVAYSTQKPIDTANQIATFKGKDASDKVYFEGLPFGTYVLKVDMVADYPTLINETTSYGKSRQVMTYLTDFAYSKKASPNPHYGADAHYTDYYTRNDAIRHGDESLAGKFIYTLDEIKDQVNLLSNAGIGMVRTDLKWSDLQKAKNTAYTMPSLIKDSFEYVKEKGVTALANLQLSDRAGYGTGDNWYHDIADDPNGIAEFGKYCTFAATELDGIVDHFSVLNEFDLKRAKDEPSVSGDGYDAGEPNITRYNKFVNTAADSIRAVQPNAWIDAGQIGTNPMWQHQTQFAGKYQWTNRWYASGGPDKADSISFHAYNKQKGPENEDNYGFTYWARWGLNDKGYGNKKVWVTENGWPSRPFDKAAGAYNTVQNAAFDLTSYKKQAEYYPRSLAIHAANTVDMYMFYEFQDDRNEPFANESNFGVIRDEEYRTPFAAKPAYVSIAAFNSLVGDEIASSTALSGSNTLDNLATQTYNKLGYKITNADGDSTYAVWCAENASAPGSFNIQTGKNYAVVYDLYGNVVKTVSGGNVTVYCSTSIQYVKGMDSLPVETPGLTAEKNGNTVDSLWYLNNGENIVLRYMPAGEVSVGDEVMLICAAYGADDSLLYVDAHTKEFTGSKLSAYCNVYDDAFKNCTRVEFYAMENGTIKPLAGSIPVTQFRNDTENVSISKSGDKITISGSVAALANKQVGITVLSKNTKKDAISAANFANYCLYQGQVKADKNGNYSIDVMVKPEDFDGAAAYITASGYSTQRWIY